MKNIGFMINAADVKSHINPEVYGSFAEHLGRCIYNGIFVGKDSDIPNTDGIRNDIIQLFKDIKLPVLRWPGGCFADEYHWKDGIGPLDQRKKMINTNWGGVTEDNSFGTHEFMRLCELVGCEPYITGNLGSGTVEEMSNWIEYMTSDADSPLTEARKKNGREKPWKLKYFAVGNENWGCGGQMSPGTYVANYRRYSQFCKNYHGNTLYRVACGPCQGDVSWTEGIMKDIHGATNAIAMHYYTNSNYNGKNSSTDFCDDTYYKTVKSCREMDRLINLNAGIIRRYSDRVDLVVDEWGTWYSVEPGTNPGFLYQQNTMRDAIVAANTFDIFNKHTDIVKMANIAQSVNVLQAIILTEGAKLIKTPTYYAFDLFKEHQNADLIYSYTDNYNKNEIPAVSSSASTKDGTITFTVTNNDLEETLNFSGKVFGFTAGKASGRILTNEVHAHNDFDDPDKVKIELLPVTVENGNITFTLPPCSVAEIRIEQ